MSTLEGMTIGFIGLGTMGRGMCRNLRAAGARLQLYNRTRAQAEALLAEFGDMAIIADTPRLAAAGATITIINVTDTEALLQTARGDDGAIAGLALGRVLIDMGTSGVLETRELAAEVEAVGGEYVDAPVSGGEGGARDGTLSIMVGAQDAVLRTVRPVLEVLGQQVTHVGPVGAGQVAKAANQTIVGLTIAAVAEALTLARRAGIDPAKVRDALRGGFADSRILEVHGERMIKPDFTPGARATIQRKDIRQVLDLAERIGLDLPTTRLNLRLWDEMIARGYGELDHAALIKRIEEG